MVFNDFILSLQLDPRIFNPFDGAHADGNYQNYSEEECDNYILEDDFDAQPSNHEIGHRQETNSISYQSCQFQEVQEEPIGSKSCDHCSYCQVSSDAFAGSDDYVCTCDGEPIVFDDRKADRCSNYKEKEFDFDDDYVN